MHTFNRLLRHAKTSRASARKQFPEVTLAAITSLIQQGEQRHRAEIRLIIEAAMPSRRILQRQSTRARACALFVEHGIWDTENNCGILIYLNMADRKVEIVADRGVAKCLSTSQWQKICQILTDGFSTGIFHDSVIAAVNAMNSQLERALPASGDPEKRLDDQPLLL